MRFVHRLDFKYFAAVACVAALVTIVLGGLLLGSYRDDLARLEGTSRAALERELKAALEAQVREFAQPALADLAIALARGEPARMRLVARGLLARDDVRAVEVRDVRGELLHATLVDTDLAGPWHPVELAILPGGGVPAAPLGTLRLDVSLADVAVGVQELEEELASARRGELRARVVLFAGTVLGLVLLGSAVAWVLAKRVRRPISKLISSVDRMGQGDYSRPVQLDRRDELGELADAVERMRQKLRATTITKEYLDVVLNSMNDVVLVTSPEGRIKRANDAAMRLLGWSEAELAGRDVAALLAPAARESFAVEQAANDTRETLFTTRAGEEVPVSLSGSTIGSDDPQFQGVIFVARNIADRKRAERRIRYLARYDALTRVPNRMQFQHLLQQAIARAQRTRTSLALLYLDLDRFKDVNDTFGHAAGDRTLEILSERLTRLVPKDAVVGRLAGDEFAIFVENLPATLDQRATLAATARELLDDVSRVFYLNNNEVFLTVSIGIALCPADANNTIDLIRNADAAMYHSKQNGGGTFAFYSPEMNAVAVERLMLKSKLRRSLQRDEFVIRYMPKVDLRDGRVTGAEALLRWRLPGHGDIPPAQFIPLAEETNLIQEIGEWVLRRVCADYREWRVPVADPGRISINLSLKQLKQASFITRFGDVFREYGVAPSRFELEITETTLMDDARHTVQLLGELHALGIHLSIDDFGTGYSSLSALQQMPVETIKIDQSFVRDAHTDRDDATLVRTIIEMGRNLEMDVVAEGVETVEQLAFLRERGCHFAQGRLFGEPLTAAEFLALLERQERGERPYARLFESRGPGPRAAVAPDRG